MPKRAFCCTAQIVALCLLAGCSTIELFTEIDLPESEDVETAEFPRLVDTPEPPPPGAFGPGVPDPAEGAAAVTDLSVEASVSAARAEPLNEPVLSESDLRRLGKR